MGVDRLALLPRLAANDYMHAEYLEYSKKDLPAANASWAQSKTYAQEALTLAEKLWNHPGYGAAVYQTNVALGTHALREGDRRNAVRYMLEAAKAPASDGFARPAFGLESRLVNYLLKAGERESVAEFLERSAALRPAAREQLLKDAAAIRAGVMPLSFQYMMAHGG